MCWSQLKLTQGRKTSEHERHKRITQTHKQKKTLAANRWTADIKRHKNVLLFQLSLSFTKKIFESCVSAMCACVDVITRLVNYINCVRLKLFKQFTTFYGMCPSLVVLPLYLSLLLVAVLYALLPFVLIDTYTRKLSNNLFCSIRACSFAYIHTQPHWLIHIISRPAFSLRFSLFRSLDKKEHVSFYIYLPFVSLRITLRL